MGTSFGARWRLLLLGDDHRQQARAGLALIALVVYAGFAVLQHVEVLLGLIDAWASWRLTAWYLAGALCFYALARSAWGLGRVSSGTLTTVQMLWAMVAISAWYAITGPARGAVMVIMMLVILFGVVALTPRRAYTLAGTGFAMLGGVMAWKGYTDPLRYDPRVEGIHLAFAAIVMLGCTALADRLRHLRARLEQQRAELARSLERIEMLATRDELTGLLNRRAASERLREAAAAGQRHPPALTLALLDLDHFKRINDTHGHAAGDEVLRRFARAAQDELRAGDLLARWGGEEFLLVLPGGLPGHARAALGRLRARLAASDWSDVAPALVVTFSAGVAECAGLADIESAIARADAGLYIAKRSGRNREGGEPCGVPAAEPARSPSLAPPV